MEPNQRGRVDSLRKRTPALVRGCPNEGHDLLPPLRACRAPCLNAAFDAREAVPPILAWRDGDETAFFLGVLLRAGTDVLCPSRRCIWTIWDFSHWFSWTSP